MDNKTFNSIFAAQFERCAEVLCKKEKEYATNDRLHNFNIAASLRSMSPRQILAGLMIKHTVSLYDMCADDTRYPEELWDEKITDHINYLILLKGILEEEKISDELDTCREHILHL